MESGSRSATSHETDVFASGGVDVSDSTDTGSTSVAEVGNVLTGARGGTTLRRDQTTGTQTRTRGDRTLSVSVFQSATAAVTQSGNEYTGEYTLSQVSTTYRSQQGDGRGASGPVDVTFEDMQFGWASVGESGNGVTGDYSRTGLAIEQRTLTQGGGGGTLLFVSADTQTRVGSGNGVTGDGAYSDEGVFSSTLTTTGSTTAAAFLTVASGMGHSPGSGEGTQSIPGGPGGGGGGSAGTTSFTATQTTTLTSTSHRRANAVTGVYAVGGFGTQVYSLRQTLAPPGGCSLTVTENGTAWVASSGWGSALTGEGTATESANDSYTLTETGTHAGGSVDIVVTGLGRAQTSTLTDARGDRTSVTASGGEQFVRVWNGVTDSGSLSWASQSGGAAAVGGVSHSASGSSRFNLIEGFVPAATDVGGGTGADGGQQAVPGELRERPARCRSGFCPRAFRTSDVSRASSAYLRSLVRIGCSTSSAPAAGCGREVSSTEITDSRMHRRSASPNQPNARYRSWRSCSLAPTAIYTSRTVECTGGLSLPCSRRKDPICSRTSDRAKYDLPAPGRPVTSRVLPVGNPRGAFACPPGGGLNSRRKSWTHGTGSRSLTTMGQVRGAGKRRAVEG